MTHQKSREPEVSLDVIRDDIFKVLIGKKTKPTKTLSTKTFISNKTILQNEGKTETFPEKQRLRTAVAHICCLLYKILDQFRLKKIIPQIHMKKLSKLIIIKINIKVYINNFSLN
jgi:hypothetical protein